MRAPLLLVALLAFAATLYFVLQPNAQTTPTASGDLGTRVDEEVEPGPAEVESAPAVIHEEIPDTVSEGASKRNEVGTGHRVRVLNPDGTAAVGARVRFFAPEGERAEEMLTFWRDHPGEVMWGGPSEKLLQSDANGEVTLPTFGAVIASVAEQGRVGHVVCEAVDGATDDALTLQLRAVPMIEIQVLDAGGNPVQDRYRLTAHVAQASKADVLPADASAWDQDQVWRYHMGVGKIADGREMLSFEIGPRTAERLGPVDGPLRYRVSLSGGLAEFAPREFDASEPGPIVFQYPALGSMAVQLVGYPAGAVPQVWTVSEEVSDTQGAVGDLSEDGVWYEFDGLPTGAQFDVRVLTQLSTSERGDTLAHTRMPTTRVSGPVSPGERVEHRLEFERPPGFYGRFVFPEDMPMSVDDFVYLTSRSTGSGRVLFAAGNRAWDWAESSVFADGSFFVSVERLRRQDYDIRNVEAIAFQWIQQTPREEERPDVWIPARLWVTIPAQSTSLDDAVDLGDVPISMHNPLMKVRVIDGGGTPISGAQVKLQYQQKHFAESGSDDYFSDANYDLGLTDDLGESWVIGRDWHAALGMRNPASLQANEAGQLLHAVRVTASHPSASAASKTLLVSELGLKSIEIQLSASGKISGSVIPVALLPYLDIAVVPPGAEYGDAWRKTGVDRAWVDFRGQREPAEKPFEIVAVPPGLWDVVFSVRRYGAEEFHRVPGVRVVANEVTEDPRLQSLALQGLVGFTRIVLRDATGRILNQSLSDEYDPTVMILVRGGGAGMQFHWVDDAMVLPIPMNESADLAITADGWETLVLRDTSDAEIQATVRRTQAAALTIRGLVPLPAGMRLEFTLQPGTNYFGRASWKSDQADPSKVLLRTTGEHAVSWHLREGDKYILGGSGTVQITPEQVYSGASLELDLPQSFVDHLNG